MKKSKRGFTLAEITLVVAIIVILSAATIGGVATMINNAKDNATAVELHAGCWYIVQDGKKVVVSKDTPGAQYYSDWDEMYEQIKNINVTIDQPDPETVTLNPGNGGGTDTGGDAGSSGGSGGSGGESGGSGSGNSNTVDNDALKAEKNKIDQQYKDELKKMQEIGYTSSEYNISYDSEGRITGITWHWDPSKHDGKSYADALKEYNDKQNQGSSGSGNSGNGNDSGNDNGSNGDAAPTLPAGVPSTIADSRPSGSTPHVTSSAGTDASGSSSSCYGNGGNISFNGTAITSYVIHVPDGIVIRNDQGGHKENLGNGYYRITYSSPVTGSDGYYKSGYTDLTDTEKSQVYIVEYTT